MVIGIAIRQREDLPLSLCARDLLASGTMKTAACFVRRPGALVAFAAQAPFNVLHQRFRFQQVRCVKAFCELLIDRLH